MTTDNALDPPPVRKRSGRAPYRRTAAIVAGVVIAVALIFVIGKIVLKPPAADTQHAGFQRSAAASTVQAPPAVAPKVAAETRANIHALQRAANSPALAARPVQVASVSPPAGPAPTGAGVVRSKTTIGPAAG